MNLVKNIVLIALFFLLSPNILFRLPGNKYVSALLHGAIFAVLWYVSNPILEGFTPKQIKCANAKKSLQNAKTDLQKNAINKQITDLKC